MRFLQSLWARLHQPWFAALARSALARRLFWGATFCALITVLLAGQVLPERIEVRLDQPSPKEILAARDVVDRLTTEARAKEAEDKVTPIPRVDPDVALAAKIGVRGFFEQMEEYRRRSDMELAKKVAELSTVPPRLPEAVLSAALSASPEDLERAKGVAVARLDAVLADLVSEQSLSAQQTRQESWTPEGITDRNLQVLVRELVKAGIRPNQVLDVAATVAAKRRAREDVLERQPVVIKKGEKVVGKGDRVNREKFEVLKDLGVVGPPEDNRVLVGVGLITLLVLGMVGVYLDRYRPAVLTRVSRLLLVGLTGTLTLALGLLLRNWSGFAMPLAAGTMLITVLVDAHVGLVVAVALGLLTGVATSGDWPVTVVATLSAIAGVYNLRRVEQRTDIIRAGLSVAGVSVLTILALHLIQGKGFDLETGQMMELGQAVGAGMVSGVLSAVLTIGSLPFLESLFGILTPIKLLELANPNHPLLRRLMVDAPGSYHHTILVANLCEAGAEAVGCDPVLARVGAYFHDIGKVKRPYFFTENQFGGENPHDRLPPHLSAMIIAQHVKDGVELAREHRLPPEIVDFVREHHGDLMISFFFNKAAENGSAERVLEEDFRYDGPRPRSRETAICMLADGCEASVRALRQRGPLTQGQIEAQVRRIIDDRLEQGQLDNVDLTLRDLRQVGRSFVKVLGGVHHNRIEYPPFAREVENGDPDQRPAGTGTTDSSST